MSRPLSVQTIFRLYDLDPKKSLGQNFLVDDSYLDEIVAAADLTEADTVLEIGPGLGTLTRVLGDRAGRVVAVELDDRLITVLRTGFATRDNITIVHGDILELDPPALLAAANEARADVAYKVVANLPYYITSPVLRHLLEATPPAQRIVVMVQQEVAARICAAPGDLSILAVSVQFYAVPSIVCSVPARAFYPRPKVDSAVLRLDVRPQPYFPEADPTRFFAIVRAGFGQKRKQLLNSLSGGLGLDKAQIRAALETAGIDPRRRAQTLSLDEWGALYAVLA
ncbi:MAG: 16S rRNA (adenine(1518)-N(6)/adenine(1519)-N(6))-dimethyltransferase RsmA [Caldilineaceae bacterium]|nr:16S rRNA (adenine(1518)-N(6)/adenine(1519)-N(6))-dimethyltransferase RsmA [Caldilineaceae bacterium]